MVPSPESGIVPILKVENVAESAQVIPKREIKVQKIWGDRNDKNPEGVTLQLMLDGEVMGSVKFEKNETTQSHTFTVDKSDVSGKELNYTIREINDANQPIPEGGEITLGGKSYKVSYSGDMKTGLEVINVEKTISTMDLTVKKQWSKSDGTVLELPPVEKVKFKLYRDGVEQDTKELSKDNNWSYQFLLLPISDKISGKPYVYIVKELDSNDKLLEKKEEFTLGSRKFVVDYLDFNSKDKSTEEIEDIPIEPIPAGDIEIPTLEEEDIPEEVEQSEDDEELIGIEEDEVPQGSKDMKPKYKKVLAKTGGLEVRFISYSFFFMLAIVLFVGINRYKKKSR